MYKQASKSKLRIETSRGALSIEQIWDLPLAELDKLAVELEEKTKTSATKSFIAEKTTEDATAQLKFDIVLDILKTKMEANKAALDQKKKKENNQKIHALIERKKENKMEEMSVEELEKMLID